MSNIPLLDLEAGPIAAGGGCVARANDGRVVFVRHCLPGERVFAAVTEETKSYLRADALEIIHSSPDRVPPPCPYAGPGRCGGCDWQHVALAAQRRLKADLVAEQLRAFLAGGIGQRRDHRADARARLQQALAHQVGDDLVRRVGIDAKFSGERAHRRKGLARTHLPGDDRPLGGVDDLVRDGQAGLNRDEERCHVCISTTSTHSLQAIIFDTSYTGHVDGECAASADTE